MGPLRYAWGKYIRQKEEAEDDTLTRHVVKTFEFLFKAILEGIARSDGKDGKSDESPLINNESHSFVLNEGVAETLMSEAFGVLFGNVTRYLDVLKQLEDGAELLYKEVGENMNQEQSFIDYLIDD